MRQIRSEYHGSKNTTIEIASAQISAIEDIFERDDTTVMDEETFDELKGFSFIPLLTTTTTIATGKLSHSGNNSAMISGIMAKSRETTKICNIVTYRKNDTSSCLDTKVVESLDGGLHWKPSNNKKLLLSNIIDMTERQREDGLIDTSVGWSSNG